MDFASRATLIPGALPTSNSYKEKIIKLLPYHSFYGGHIPSRKVEPPYLAVHLKKKKKPPGPPFTSIPPQKFKLHLSGSLQHSTLNISGYYLFFVEYELITCW